MAPRRYRRRRSKTARQFKVALVACVLLAWAWQTHPVWTALGAVAAVAVAVAWWRFQRERDRQALTARGERTWLYRHYDGYGVLLYVGITNDYRRRCEQHADDKWWWPQVDPSRSTTQLYPNRFAALAAERQAIRTEAPVFNIAHNGRRLAA